MKSLVVLDRDEQKALIRHRRALGVDRHDEVWDGVYVIMPLGDNEHQELAGKLTTALDQALGSTDSIRVFPGVNVSDQAVQWKKNFRCPDVAVFLPENSAQDRGTHYLGGPDFAVEVISPNDRSRRKFAFYAAVGVRELLLVSRKPWKLELYSRQTEEWVSIGKSDLEQPDELKSVVLSLTFRLVSGGRRPRLQVARLNGAENWLA